MERDELRLAGEIHLKGDDGVASETSSFILAAVFSHLYATVINIKNLLDPTKIWQFVLNSLK